MASSTPGSGPDPSGFDRLDVTLGGLTLVALVLLALSGAVLTQYYNPAVLASHDSIRYILTQVPLVGFLRDVHIWSASAALVLAFGHLAAVFWRRGFRPPRGHTWWTAVLLLGVIFGLAFTGTVLSGDQGAVEALAHATAGATFAGPFGSIMSPGFTPSSPLPTRLYGLHVSVLPLAMIAILAIHLWLLRQLTVPVGGGSGVLFRSRLRPLSGFAFLLVSLVTTVALVFPHGLLPVGVGGMELTKPFWPFLWIYAAENIFGMTGMVLAPGILFGFLALVPVADRQDGAAARLVRVLGVLLFVLMVAGIVYAALAPGQSHLDMQM